MYIILGCLIDGISMIVLTAVIVLPMVKQAGLRSRLVRRLSRHPCRDGADHAAGRLQPVRAAEHERQGYLTVARAAFPFFLLLLVAVSIITEFPQIVLFLPKLAFPD